MSLSFLCFDSEAQHRLLTIIDIFVPADRVLDTVDIYFIQERQRRLSLRFLSYLVLKEEIQIDTHDSIEDARAALLLYQTAEEKKKSDPTALNDLIQWVYSEGKKLVSTHFISSLLKHLIIFFILELQTPRLFEATYSPSCLRTSINPSASHSLYPRLVSTPQSSQSACHHASISSTTLTFTNAPWDVSSTTSRYAGLPGRTVVASVGRTRLWEMSSVYLHIASITFLL